MGLRDRLRRFLFGYDAATDKHRRKVASPVIQSEDAELQQSDRQKLIGSAHDLRRNFSIAAWAIRKHLDYVATFAFQARTTDKAFNTVLEAMVANWSKASNFDVARRHSLPRALRLAEASRTVAGDVFPLKLADGRVQWIEGDRIRTPATMPQGLSADRFTHGVLTGPGGIALGYAIHNRDKLGRSFLFERMEPAENVLPIAYYDRFDQVRGVSPLTSAINSFQDVYEGLDYALAKAKVSQLFALAFYREAAEDAAPNVETEQDADTGAARYEVDFGRGPIKLELDPGDRAEFLESNQPSTEFQAFCQLVISIALKSLDIPYCFFDEAHTNFSGARQAWLMYDQSAKAKRQDLKEFLDALLAWRIGLWILDDELQLPPGIAVDDIAWEWIPAGIPWIDPQKEIMANVMAVNNALTSRQRVAKSGGDDWFQIVDELADEEKYLAEKGLTVPAAATSKPAAAANQPKDLAA
jgi:capsid protein